MDTYFCTADADGAIIAVDPEAAQRKEDYQTALNKLFDRPVRVDALTESTICQDTLIHFTVTLGSAGWHRQNIDLTLTGVDPMRGTITALMMAKNLLFQVRFYDELQTSNIYD